MRRLLAIVLGVLLVGAAAPSTAAPPKLQRQLLVASYDGPGPAMLAIQGEVQAKGRPGYFATVDAEVLDGTVHPFFPDVIDLGGDAPPPHVYGPAGSHDVCASPVVSCATEPSASTLSFSSSFTITAGSRPIHVRLLLAMEGTSVRADSVAIGWKVQKRTSGFARATGGGAGASAYGLAVEAQPQATLPGGGHGSIAVAVPPCEIAGAGVVTLTGGPSPAVQACPGSPFADAAPKATQWSLSGAAAGVSAYRTRLLVIGL